MKGCALKACEGTATSAMTGMSRAGWTALTAEIVVWPPWDSNWKANTSSCYSKGHQGAEGLLSHSIETAGELSALQ